MILENKDGEACHVLCHPARGGGGRGGGVLGETGLPSHEARPRPPGCAGSSLHVMSAQTGHEQS